MKVFTRSIVALAADVLYNAGHVVHLAGRGIHFVAGELAEASQR